MKAIKTLAALAAILALASCGGRGEKKQMDIDGAYIERSDTLKMIPYDDGEYEKYGITKLNTMGMSSVDRFYFDDMDVSFAVVEEIVLCDDFRSLIIRGDTEYALGIWLVNFDSEHNYIDSFPIGYDEWAESASWITSVIHFHPELLIDREYVSWEEAENSQIKVLESGKFTILKTIKSKREM